MKKQIIILFGPPGAGKGSQSQLLAEKLGLHLFETSKILEREFKKAENLPKDSEERFTEIEGEKFDIFEEKKNWETGILNSPPWVTYLVKKEVEKLAEQGESIVFAGSPRTMYEAERLTPVLEKLFGKENISIFLIEISAETTIFRNTHRKICELMRHSILFSKETENLTVCPLDGSALLKRESLDDPETIKVRIKEYLERTLPMVDFFEKYGIPVKKINGETTISQVHKEIISNL